MLFFPNCKINIGLNVISRRSDGYHDLETVFYPVYKLYDALEVLPQPDAEKPTAPDSPVSDISCKISGLPIEGSSEKNLCIKAYHLLKADFPDLPPIQMCLHKTIPMGAGLGGGSADGAFMLRLLNEKFRLNLLQSQLLAYALQLGSDCPFFIINKPTFAQGRGEMLEEIPVSLAGYSIVLIHPNIHVSTAQAFAGIQPAPKQDDLAESILQPIESWKETISNDFEQSVFRLHPLLAQIKERLYQTGALYASMSGSGSSIYGIYATTQLPAQKLFPQYFEIHTAL